MAAEGTFGGALTEMEDRHVSSLVDMLWELRDSADLAADDRVKEFVRSTADCKPFLYAIVRCLDDTDMLVAAFKLLVELCKTAVEHAQLARTAGAVDVVLDAMAQHAGDLKVQAFGCQALWFICGRGLFFAGVELALATKTRAVEAVVTALATQHTTLGMQHVACLALAALMLNDEVMRVRATLSGAAAAVMNALRESAANADVVAAGIEALGLLRAGNQDGCTITTQLEAVLSAFRAHGATLAMDRAVCLALMWMIESSHDYRTPAVKLGCLDVVLACSGRHLADANTQWACFSIFYSTCLEDAHIAAEVVAAGGIEAVVAGLQAHAAVDNVPLYGYKALLALTKHRAEDALRAVAAGALELQTLCADGECVSARNAALAQLRAAVHDDFSRSVVQFASSAARGPSAAERAKREAEQRAAEEAAHQAAQAAAEAERAAAHDRAVAAADRAAAELLAEEEAERAAAAAPAAAKRKKKKKKKAGGAQADAGSAEALQTADDGSSGAAAFAAVDDEEAEEPADAQQPSASALRRRRRVAAKVAHRSGAAGAAADGAAEDVPSAGADTSAADASADVAISISHAADAPLPSGADVLAELFPWLRMVPQPAPPAVAPPAVAAPPPLEPPMSAIPTAELARLRAVEEATLCAICLDATRCVALLPCKHLLLCGTPACAAMLGAPPLCPSCRVPVADTLQLFV